MGWLIIKEKGRERRSLSPALEMVSLSRIYLPLNASQLFRIWSPICI